MENNQSNLEQFLKRLERCGDFALAAQRAGASDEQLNHWFNDPDILSKIALARCKGLMRKNLRAPLMESEQFSEALRYCYNCSTKRGSRNEIAIINLLIKNPKVKDQDGADKLKISIAAYKMRKKRLISSFFKHLTMGSKK
jgi:hypothetical protein